MPTARSTTASSRSVENVKGAIRSDFEPVPADGNFTTPFSIPPRRTSYHSAAFDEINVHGRSDYWRSLNARSNRNVSTNKEDLSSASMNIRKWITNDREVATAFSDSVADNQAVSVPSTWNSKVLGLRWNIMADTFGFKLESVPKTSTGRTVTKRLVLHSIAKVYDPLGFLSPFVVTPKILLQDLWKQNLDWDDELPDDLLHKWLEWCEGLQALSELCVPRFLGEKLQGCITTTILHIFTDASPRAYGVVAYACVQNAEGNRTTRLLLAKSRVAPLKAITLAKLELTSPSLAARMSKYIKDNTDLNIVETHL